LDVEGIKTMFPRFSLIKGSRSIPGTQDGCLSNHPPACRLPFLFLVIMVFIITDGCSPYGPIHSAAMKGDSATLDTLLKSDPALVSSKDKLGQTPLHYAVQGGNKESVQFLLANKAEINAKNEMGWTPLHIAAVIDREDMVQLLLANKADVNARTSYEDILVHSGMTPLHIAASGGFNDLVELLLKNKAEVDARTSHQWTPLHFAALKGNKIVVEKLLINKAEVNARTSEGWTPLLISTSYFHHDVAEILRQHGGHE
jgi:ankyrin repeat protein